MMMQPIEDTIQFFPVMVPAGFPSAAPDYITEEIDLNKFLKGNSDSACIIRVQGDSMIGAHITDNSLLVVDRSMKPRHNAIVVAIVNGEYTVKRLSMMKGVVSLVPANVQYKPLIITQEMQFEIWGVVTSIIINAKQL